ncbi:MAG: dienelactone hydrolase family protein [Bacteroidia bacterium]|nr:dienelactone hydrolase family protein [Bacteroidia bacterium]NNJ82203.1 phospholipase [Flavobacteriaceae bacterium]NNK53574.1 phospholipase [Flavobacteriaceae bacterium]NNM08926.1 phospholipase [Flavobacteriaceae bacterium]
MKHYALTITVLLNLIFLSHLQGQTNELYDKGIITSGFDSLPYRFTKPKNYDPALKYPLIIFLHGSGERGADNELQLKHGASFFASDSIRDKYPAIVVFPQCDTNNSWHNGTYAFTSGKGQYSFPKEIKENISLNLVEILIREFQMQFNIDSDRMYLGGLSMGAMGTYEMVNRNPNKFAAAFAICGGANPEIAERLQFTGCWIFHGEADDVVPVEWSEHMYEAIKKKSGDVKISIYPNVKHDSWTNAFNEPELMEWLFSNHKN